MAPLRTSRIPLILAVVGGLFVGGSSASGDDFRVENRVFVGYDSQPRVVSTTIFQNGLVYDYLEEPAEVTVFDPDHGRFVLLNESRRVRTEIGLDEMKAFVKRLQQWALGHEDEYMRFLANPAFEADEDASNEKLVFNSRWMSYRLRMSPDAASPTIVQQYRRFCDAYAQLNTLITPGARLPFPRMFVNRAIEAEGRLPREVTLVLTPSGSSFAARRTTIRSEHRLVERLVESDRQRLAQTREFMSIFQPVKFGEYQEALGKPKQ